MIDRYEVRVAWGNRPDTMGICANALRSTCECLSELDPCFKLWYEQGRSRKDALSRPIPCENTERLLELLEKAQQKQIRATRGVITNLGAQLTLWNGLQDLEAAGLSVTCGLHAGTEQSPLGNNFILSLPYAGSAFERTARLPLLMDALACLVRNWHPDWGGVFSTLHWRDKRNAFKPMPFVSWILYLPVQSEKLKSVGVPADIQSLGNFGSIITIVQDRFDVHRADHVQASERVQTALVQAGILSRIPLNARFPLEDKVQA